MSDALAPWLQRAFERASATPAHALLLHGAGALGQLDLGLALAGAALCESQLPNINVTEVVKPFGDLWTANIAAVAAGSGMPGGVRQPLPDHGQHVAAQRLKGLGVQRSPENHPRSRRPGLGAKTWRQS